MTKLPLYTISGIQGALLYTTDRQIGIGRGYPCLPLMREVGRRKATQRERKPESLLFVGKKVKLYRFSLPQSASLTAPSSEGAFGWCHVLTVKHPFAWQIAYRKTLIRQSLNILQGGNPDKNLHIFRGYDIIKLI